MTALTAVPPFMGAVRASSAQGFDAAIFGAPHGTPYPEIDNSIHRGAPDAFRAALAVDAEWLDHWDYDLGGPLLRHGQKLCDLGNLRTRPRDGAHNRALIEQTTRRILEAGAVPIMFGGDDSVPIPFIAAYSGSAGNRHPADRRAYRLAPGAARRKPRLLLHHAPRLGARPCLAHRAGRHARHRQRPRA